MTDEKKHAEDIEEVLQKFVARCKYGISSSDISLVAKEIVAKTDEVMPTITDEEIEAHFTTPHYHYEKGHYYKIRKDRIFGAKWMRDEIRKRMGKKFDGNKSVDETMPTGEAERDDAEDFLSTKDIWNHPRITDRCDKESYEVADLMAEFATAWFRYRMGEVHPIFKNHGTQINDADDEHPTNKEKFDGNHLPDTDENR